MKIIYKLRNRHIECEPFGIGTARKFEEFVTAVVRDMQFPKPVEVTVQTSVRHGIDFVGECWCYPSRSVVKLYLCRISTFDQMIQVCAHELGHAYHYQTDIRDFRTRTDYGKELYAEEFSQMVLLDKYQKAYATYLPSYNGYRTNVIYNT